jgi:hypothetical protein
MFAFEQEKEVRNLNHLGDLGVDGRIILKLNLKKQVGRVWTRLK